MPQTGEGQGAGTPAPQLSLPTTLGGLPVVGSNWNVSCRRGRGDGQVTPVQGPLNPIVCEEGAQTDWRCPAARGVELQEISQS